MTITEYILHYGGIFIPNKWKDYLKHIVKWEVFSERIIENPIIIRHIPQSPSVILDVGSRYSQVPLELASLGHKVFALDIEDYAFKHKNLTFVKEDIRKTSFPNEFFDVVTIISTLEHVGMGKTSYSDRRERDGDITAFKEIARIVKPGGIVLFTVPFGKAKFLPFLRVYDLKRIRRLQVGSFSIEKRIFMYNDNENWEISTYNKVKDIENTHHTIGNAFFLFRKKRK
jgi:SAM-dependent methyltransferase